MSCTSIAYPISQHIAMLTHYFSNIRVRRGEYIKHLIPANQSRTPGNTASTHCNRTLAQNPIKDLFLGGGGDVS